MKKSLIFLVTALSVALLPQSARADCGQAPGGSVTINSACSFAAPCTNTANAGCNYNGVDNGNITIGASGALTINAGQTIYFNPGQSVSITPGGYINIGKSGSVTGALSKGYLWVPGSGTTMTSDAPTVTANTSAPGGGYIRRYQSSTLYCAAAASCPTACGYAGGTVAGGQDTNGNCLTTSCAATAACCTVVTWYRDADGDGYGNPSITLSQCTQPAGYVSNNSDCYDSNANAKPGQTAYFTTNRGDGSYDYNCDGSQTVDIAHNVTVPPTTHYVKDIYGTCSSTSIGNAHQAACGEILDTGGSGNCICNSVNSTGYYSDLSCTTFATVCTSGTCNGPLIGQNQACH